MSSKPPLSNEKAPLCKGSCRLSNAIAKMTEGLESYTRCLLFVVCFVTIPPPIKVHLDGHLPLHRGGLETKKGEVFSAQVSSRRSLLSLSTTPPSCTAGASHLPLHRGGLKLKKARLPSPKCQSDLFVGFVFS